MKIIIASIILFVFISCILIYFLCVAAGKGLSNKEKDDEQIEYIKKWKEENKNNGDHQY